MSNTTPSAPAPAPATSPAPGAPYAPAPQLPYDGLGIAAFVCGLCGLALIPIILGHMSLSRIKRGGARGAGFAVVGLILGYFALACYVILGIVAGSSIIWALNS